MEYAVICKIKDGKEVKTLNSIKQVGDGVFMLARIQACTQLYKKIQIREVSENSYEIICIGRKD